MAIEWQKQVISAVEKAIKLGGYVRIRPLRNKNICKLDIKYYPAGEDTTCKEFEILE